MIRVAIAVLVGLLVPLVQLVLACRRPVAEACVWGKAYLPLSLALYLVLVGVPAYLLLGLLSRGKRPRN